MSIGTGRRKKTFRGSEWNAAFTVLHQNLGSCFPRVRDTVTGSVTLLEPQTQTQSSAVWTALFIVPQP